MATIERILLSVVAIFMCFNVSGTSLGSNTIELCRSKMTVFSPRVTADKNGRWYSGDNLQDKLGSAGQEVIGEICENPGTSCSPLVYFPSSYKASCVQDYIYLDTLVLDSEGRETRAHEKIPSSCNCELKRGIFT